MLPENEQRDAVVKEARSWVDAKTPYHAHARLKGIGVDCANLLCAVYEACGLVAPIDPGFYAPGWHLHRNEEMFLDWIKKAGGTPVTNRPPLPGDLAVWRWGRTYSHGGIVTSDDLVVHSYLDAGVIETSRFEEPLASHPVLFWTLWS